MSTSLKVQVWISETQKDHLECVRVVCVLKWSPAPFLKGYHLEPSIIDHLAAYVGENWGKCRSGPLFGPVWGCVWWFRSRGGGSRGLRGSVCLPSPVSLLVCIPHNRGRRQGVSLGLSWGGWGRCFVKGGRSPNSSGRCTIIRIETHEIASLTAPSNDWQVPQQRQLFPGSPEYRIIFSFPSHPPPPTGIPGHTGEKGFPLGCDFLCHLSPLPVCEEQVMTACRCCVPGGITDKVADI